MFHKGSFFDEKLFYEFEYSFTGANEYKDLFLGYKNEIGYLNLKYRFKYGNIKIPFSLETYTSSKYVTFMERALTDSFAYGRKMGGEMLLSTEMDGKYVNLFAATFSNSIDERNLNLVETPGYSIRLTYAQKLRKGHMFSVGAARMGQNMQGTDVRFNQASESEFVNNKYVSVRVKNVDTLDKNNVEAVYIYDKFSLQGEYALVSVNALLDNYVFDAHYLQGSYFIFGNSRKYRFSNSTIARVNPNKDGSLEVAFRYSYINLNDNGITGLYPENGGIQVDYNYGVNWYYNQNLKFMLNYVSAEPKNTDLYSGTLQLLQARALFSF